ncbi:hypothetical protein [Aerococcus kribbianus]|uniref:Uncharacterized protein n=1 Tax=Aerococcus kribbianus TaxID=2999064 RepID=A0A9X3FX50_9LACT|nr:MULTISPECIES: hypothetical protein [unclassified Aerococcus]MCZ0717855.1 hypothetical protein [Aerococcus sp. YH-aer221]MCZ0726142.1 hypothetical protein [Aerococcus sp. YH-aer222]
MFNPTGVWNSRLGGWEPDEEDGEEYIVYFTGSVRVVANSEEEAIEGVSALDVEDWDVEVEK